MATSAVLPASSSPVRDDFLPPICAIVVTHEPGPDLESNLAALRAQATRVVVVDNASGDAVRRRLHALCGDSLECLPNAENVGLATALNQGVQHARERGFEWVATFDQDSRVLPGYFAAQWRAYRAFSGRERVALLSGRWRDTRWGVAHSFAPVDRQGDPFALVRLAITSGNLLPVRVFAEVGSYRDDFFIDYIDQEFCLRCRRAGWRLVEVRDAMFEHHYGEPTRHRLAWMRPLVTHHAPLRRYYQARNRVAVYREYGCFDPRWLAADAREFARDLAKIVCFEGRRGAKLRAVGRGLWHGITGRRGRAILDGRRVNPNAAAPPAAQ